MINNYYDLQISAFYKVWRKNSNKIITFGRWGRLSPHAQTVSALRI